MPPYHLVSYITHLDAQVNLFPSSVTCDATPDHSTRVTRGCDGSPCTFVCDPLYTESDGACVCASPNFECNGVCVASGTVRQSFVPSRSAFPHTHPFPYRSADLPPLVLSSVRSPGLWSRPRRLANANPSVVSPALEPASSVSTSQLLWIHVSLMRSSSITTSSSVTYRWWMYREEPLGIRGQPWPRWT